MHEFSCFHPSNSLPHPAGEAVNEQVRGVLLSAGVKPDKHEVQGTLMKL